MKKILPILILMSVFCLAVFAQSNEYPCQQIKLDAPLSVKYGERFKVSVVLEKPDPSVASKVNWIISKSSGIGSSDIKNQQFIKIDTEYLEQGGVITVIAFHSNEKCEDLAMINVAVFTEKNAALKDKNPCPTIKIKAPETVQPDEKFKVFASFENEVQPSISKFNWTIIKGNEVSKIKERGIIEIDTRDLEDGGVIILLAESIDDKCQNTAVNNIIVIPANGGSPLILDNYSKLDWNDEKARLANVVFSMKERKDDELFINFEFEKKTSQAKKKEYLIKVFKFLTETRGFEKQRITILISEYDLESISFQPMPKGLSNTYYCDNCVVIRGEDFEKIASLFK